MTKAPRSNRKINDEKLIRLNSVGLSLSTIAREFDCHTSSVVQRLQSLKVQPSDTRRAFMEDIYKGLSPQQQEWLVEQLGSHLSVKDFIRSLLVDKFINTNNA